MLKDVLITTMQTPEHLLQRFWRIEIHANAIAVRPLLKNAPLALKARNFGPCVRR